MSEDFASAGRISFIVKHRDDDWATNDEAYRFPEVRHAPIAIQTAKRPDGTLRVNISGPFGGAYEFRQPIPACDENGIRVGVVWAGYEVALYLNGAYCQAMRAAVSVH